MKNFLSSLLIAALSFPLLGAQHDETIMARRHTASGGSTIAYVRSTSCDGGGSSYTCTLSIPSGDTLVVGAGDDESTVSTVVTSAGDSLTKQTVSGGTPVELWAILATSSSATNVVITFTGGNHAAASASVYSGVTSLGSTATNSGSSSPATISLSSAYANDFIVSVFNLHSSGLTCTATSGNLRPNCYNSGQASRSSAGMDITSASAGSLTTSFTISPSTSWGAAAIDLRTH